MAESDLPPDALLAQGPFLRGLAAALVRDPGTADDVVQDAYVAALTHPPGSPDRVRSWLSVVLRNAVRKTRRSQSRRLLRETVAARPESTRSAADQVAREEVVRAVLEAVLRLDLPQRRVILMRFYEDLPPRAIARELAIPVNTVKSRLRAAIVRLREDLDGRQQELRSDWRATLAAAVGGTAVGAKLHIAWIVGLVALLLAVPATYLTLGWIRGADESDTAEHAAASSDAKAAAPAPRLRGREPTVASPTPASRPDATTVTGRVVGPDGGPVPGAHVRSFDAQLTGGTQAADENGNFVFPVLRPLPFGIVAVANGYATTVGPRFEWRPGETIEIGTLRLEEGFAIEGRVVDEDGQPVRDAGLGIETDADPVPESWPPRKWLTVGTQPKSTDELGRFAFTEVAAGTYRVRLRPFRDDGVEQTLDAVPAGTHDLLFVVPDAPDRIDGPVRLRVEGPDGGVVPRYRVRVSTDRGEERREVSDAHDALFVLEDEEAPVRLLVWDARSLDGAPLGHAPVLIHDLRPQPEPLVIRMDPGSTVRGRMLPEAPPGPVRLAAKCFGRPNGTWVAVPDGVKDHYLRFTQHTETRADGSFRFEGLPVGRVRITLAEKDAVPVRLRDGGCVVEVPHEDVRLEAFSSHTLRLLATAPEGLNVEWTKVRVDRWTPGGLDTIWVSSEYERPPPAVQHPVHVPGLESGGRYRLTVDAVCSGRQCTTVVLDDVSPPGEPLRVGLEIAPSITGRVLRSDGSPVPDARIFFCPWPGGRLLPHRFHADGLCPISGYTNADGRFEMQVPPDVQVLLALVARGLATAQDPPRARGGDRALEILAHPERAIGGVVSDPAGGPLHGLLVTALPADGVPSLWEPHEVATDGSFRVPRLGPGRYRIAVWNDDDRDDSRCALSEPLAAGARDVAIDLHPGTGVDARILDSDARAVIGARVVLRGPGVHRIETSDHAGRVGFTGLPPSRYELLVRAADGREARASATAHGAGRSRPVTVVLGPR